MAYNGPVAKKALKFLGNCVKVGRTSQVFWFNAGQTLHTIGNRAPGSNKGLKRVEDRLSLKLHCCDLKDGVLFRMQSGGLYIKGYANGWSFRHNNPFETLSTSPYITFSIIRFALDERMRVGTILQVAHELSGRHVRD